MRFLKVLLAAVVAATAFTVVPAEAASSLVPCSLNEQVSQGTFRSGTVQGGPFVTTDNAQARPQLLCSIQRTPQPGQGLVAVYASHGVACIQSTCTGPYVLCYQSKCGPSTICWQSRCTWGSICYQSVCRPYDALASAAYVPATNAEWSAVQGEQFFACTTVRWWYADDVYSDQPHGCVPATRG